MYWIFTYIYNLFIGERKSYLALEYLSDISDDD